MWLLKPMHKVYKDDGADERRECKHKGVKADTEDHASNSLDKVVQTSVSSVVTSNISVFVEDHSVLRGFITHELVDEHISSEVTRLSSHDAAFVNHGVHVKYLDHSREDPCRSISVSHSVRYDRRDLSIIGCG